MYKLCFREVFINLLIHEPTPKTNKINPEETSAFFSTLFRLVNHLFKSEVKFKIKEPRNPWVNAFIH